MFVRALIATALFAAFGHAATAQELPTLKVGVVNSMSAAPFYIADRLGYFKDEGINVQFMPFPSMTNMVAPLGVGQLDVAGGALAAGIYNAVGRGIDVRVVADLESDPPGYGFSKLMIRSDLVKSGKFKSIKDLKGLTIAGNTPGSTSSSQLNELLKKASYTFADVKRVFMSFPEQVAALQNGAVDAAIMPEPNATQAVREGYAVAFIGDDAWYPNEQEGVLVYGTTVLKARRDLGLKFMRAFLKAARFYNDALVNGKLAGPNANQIVAVLTSETNLKDPSVYRAITPLGINPNGHVFLKSMHTDFDFFKAQGFIETQTKPEDAVDDSFAAEAVKSLGLYVPKRG
jgi:NitT/TauT family transport system substrate-binding protein